MEGMHSCEIKQRTHSDSGSSRQQAGRRLSAASRTRTPLTLGCWLPARQRSCVAVKGGPEQRMHGLAASVSD